jgi:hypothetical protein
MAAWNVIHAHPFSNSGRPRRYVGRDRARLLPQKFVTPAQAAAQISKGTGEGTGKGLCATIETIDRAENKSGRDTADAPSHHDRHTRLGPGLRRGDGLKGGTPLRQIAEAASRSNRLGPGLCRGDGAEGRSVKVIRRLEELEIIRKRNTRGS